MHFITVTAQISDTIAALLHRFNECTAKHQLVAHVLAVIYKPIEQHALNRILELDELCDLATISNKELTHLLAELVALEVVQKSRHGFIINRALANTLVKQCIAQNRFVTLLTAAEKIAPVLSSYQWEDNTADKRRLLRDMYFLGEHKRVVELLNLPKNPLLLDWQQTPALCSVVFYPFNLDEFTQLDGRLQYQAFATLLAAHRQQGQSTVQLLQWLHQACDALPNNTWLRYLKAEQYLLAGELDKLADELDATDKSVYSLLLQASNAFFNQHLANAKKLFEQAIEAKGRYQKRKKPYLEGIYGIFYQLTLLSMGKGQDKSSWQTLLDELDNQQQDKRKGDFAVSIELVFRRILLHLQGSGSFAFRHDYLSYCERGELNYYLYVCFALGAYSWSVRTPEPWLLALKAEAIRFFDHTQLSLFSNFLKQIDGESTHFPLNITHLLSAKESWDIALEQLLALDSPQPVQAQEPSRVVWQLEVGRFDAHLKPKEQKRTKHGWSKGKALSLKRLVSAPEEFQLSDTDRAICAHIDTITGTDYYRTKEYRLNLSLALRAAIGADNIVDSEGQPLALIQREPSIRIVAHGEDLSVSIANLPPLTSQSEPPIVSIKHVRGALAEFCIFNANHLKVAKIVGESGLIIPPHAKQKAIDSIKAIAPLINIESDIEGIGESLTQTEPDKHLVINVTPHKTGLNFDCVVMPFGEQGPAMKPSLGSRHISAHIDGKRVALERDLAYEQRLLEQLDSICPDFTAMRDTRLVQSDWQSALATLEQLQMAVQHPHTELPLKLRWPRGKAIHISKQLKSEHIQLSITQRNEWFDISGSAELDDGKIMELRLLLEAMATSGGRFITLEDNRILALSEQLKEQLDVLSGAADKGLYHPMSSRLIRDHTTGMRMQTVPGWEQLHQRMSEANTLNVAIPNTLQAQLRDYQADGFDWAMRLAHWGAGGCLADDMGLGKTLQALAVIVARATKGPTLIIAPTSVCFNWKNEAAKFAPTLKMTLFSECKTRDEQLAAISQCSAFDCLVISYQQMQRHIESLERVHWHSIVADEAQALKNPLAKRTRAAYALKGDFRLITTGTPIENNLTELWSLFRFVNPGLLGNLKRFAQRFVVPIDNHEQEPAKALKAKRALKELIKPFILRRLKSEVLTELPPRTDIDHVITLSDDEQHLYEALRQNALAEISALQQLDNPGEQRIALLAQLTKLRQACCHPQLVSANSIATSSKLQALGYLLAELGNNKHKALIFSQFVGHLHLIRAYLEQQGISYQYLDGATPASARQARIDAFQAGHGEVFLISLKAGGSGLNLTAADYVIHMDPWWNPAVEQQASDRAHRIGQTRPVTVYRLIAKGTIEEKILALHHNKRALAQSLLSDYDTPQSLSVEEMMATLKEVF
ncbi:DEAD/DEAH box helicase [Pseudoalteromonas sp. SSDWG2]|uniref:DEAD/DEAH box helicase n=1 Tax=Pseudoalteromonas sp. SSDWG2 TaxID=3139391 RepID=UPI003BACACDF